MRRSFDLIGDIAVVEARSRKEGQHLVRKIRAAYPRIKTILKKDGKASGRYRLRDYSILYTTEKGGDGLTETIHVEHGCRFRLDVTKAFFNPRNATIRKRIADQVKEGERVLVMFSGVAPYPVLIARRVNADVVGVELNPAAVRYAEDNVRMNGVQESVKLFQGDVRLFRSREKFDRVVMPLATLGHRYLADAFRLCRKGGTVHLFGIGKKASPFEQLERSIHREARKAGAGAVVVERLSVGDFSPALKEVCIGFRVVWQGGVA